MDNYKFNNECNIRLYNTADYARGLLTDEELKLNRILILPTVYSLLENLIKDKIRYDEDVLMGFYPNILSNPNESEFYYREFELKFNRLDQPLSKPGYNLYKITGYNPVKKSEFEIIFDLISQELYNMNKSICEIDECATLNIPIILYENTFDDTDNLQGFENFLHQKLISFTTREKITDDRVEYVESLDRKLIGKFIGNCKEQFFEFNIGLYNEDIIKELYAIAEKDKTIIIIEYYGATREEDEEKKMKPFSKSVIYLKK